MGPRLRGSRLLARPARAPGVIKQQRHRGVQCGSVASQSASLASSVISVPARACDTGRPALPASARCMKMVRSIATGSEVSLALEAHARLTGDAIRCRVVSMPCWELFDAQPQSYRDTVLPPTVRARVSIEAAAPFGWERYIGLDGAIIGVNAFGASAPGPVVMREFGFTPEHVVETAKAMLKRIRGPELES